jgi:class 3 adenylate cyclase
MTKVQRPERRLAAVFVADVVAYSRVMGQDEVGTLAALSDHRVRFDAAAAEHDGRVVNSTGDSILAEFKSAAAAVQCAWSIQDTITEANRGIADYKRIQFRIGVHVGDVLVRGNDLFGPQDCRRWQSRGGSASRMQSTSTSERVSISRSLLSARRMPRTSQSRSRLFRCFPP